MLTPDEFLELNDDKTHDKTFRFGNIDPAYTSGRPKIVFDGTDAASVKQYSYNANYTPVANDRVMVIKNVVAFKII